MPSMAHVLVIDDEESVLAALKRRLERHGLEVVTASTAEDGIRLIQHGSRPFDVIVTDMSMEQPDAGLNVLNAAFARDLFSQVIVMTAYGNVSNAVECMRRGAFDYIEKNSPNMDVFELLTNKIDQALERRQRDARTVERWDRATKPEE